MFKIPKTLYDQIIAQAQAEAPNECCGLLSGQDGTANGIYPMTNIHQSPVSYQIDPREQFAAFKDMRKQETELVGIYHSHPHTEAYPSATDVRLAYYPEAAYLLISLQDPSRPVMKAFRIIENRIQHEKLEIIST